MISDTSSKTKEARKDERIVNRLYDKSQIDKRIQNLQIKKEQ